MLKHKDLWQDLDLVEQLEDEAAEVISGGEEVGVTRSALVAQATKMQIDNYMNIPIYFDLSYDQVEKDIRLEPGASKIIFTSQPNNLIDYDKSVCEWGIQLKTYTLKGGKKYGFNLLGDGCTIEMYDYGSIA